MGCKIIFAIMISCVLIINSGCNNQSTTEKTLSADEQVAYDYVNILWNSYSTAEQQLEFAEKHLTDFEKDIYLKNHHPRKVDLFKNPTFFGTFENANGGITVLLEGERDGEIIEALISVQNEVIQAYMVSNPFFEGDFLEMRKKFDKPMLVH
ncbi:hypothetical protein AWH56_018275 [Anaerobacillus isosaccharinicus]|uniref:Uncharacterized protein n=1 Tax=Anaerobacillus isosaccharinicus TaxID=1532552 RepID=A0A1S2LH47_9BACI|nr:hypothetical protein [Anaerobacillus isosaccharinicus]MBA5587147.1 hypothetical protein [Anaerobacillus isosaccharinicus]QOY34656.1 hypothetical protein AWH56_018275 [Anaerobacillus isosaccharinicus]